MSIDTGLFECPRPEWMRRSGPHPGLLRRSCPIPVGAEMLTTRGVERKSGSSRIHGEDVTAVPVDPIHVFGVLVVESRDLLSIGHKVKVGRRRCFVQMRRQFVRTGRALIGRPKRKALAATLRGASWKGLTSSYWRTHGPNSYARPLAKRPRGSGGLERKDRSTRRTQNCPHTSRRLRPVRLGMPCALKTTSAGDATTCGDTPATPRGGRDRWRHGSD
jgi:hypothetical protein